ncbi:potassium channel tetramerisation domain containing 15b [Elysia marginata]|uniref:Potassium channel tetramerisation domain containing 15b n=1 Tax=Elysia marginata TaxID=1093978 RepID=A0AAV4J4A6_9GAST|nr:potassium channel tetramerisation domain containing 15b [Elysia marginata]
MVSSPGDPRCPLSSFLKYVTHLHPMMDAFWQRPKRNISSTDIVWYDHTPLGSSTLTKIMQRICQQAGVSDSYTNYSIRSSCIPLVEEACEQALLAETGSGGGTERGGSNDGGVGGVPTRETTHQRSGSFMSHSNSEELSSDDGLAHSDGPNGDLGLPQHGTNGLHNNTHHSMGNEGPLPAHLPKEKPPRLGHSVGSGHSSSLDTDDGDLFGLMQAKRQVLELIRGLMVKDIQKFVDWLKTVRVQYSAGELIVLCSPVEKSNVEPIPDDILVDRNGVPTSRSATPDRDATITSGPMSRSNGVLKKSGSLDLSDKRQRLKKEASMDHDDVKLKSELPAFFGSTTIKQVDFNCVAGVHCSTEEMGSMKISIPSSDTLLLAMVPPNLQVMLHKKHYAAAVDPGYCDALPERVFYSDSNLDMAEVIASIQSWGKRQGGQFPRSSAAMSNGSPMRVHSNPSEGVVMPGVAHPGNGGYHHMPHAAVEPPALVTAGQMPAFHKASVGGATTPVQLPPHGGQQHSPSSYPPVMVIPAAHRSSASSAASLSREHYKEGRGGIMSMSGCLEVPSGMLLTPAERNSLKRGSSTGTPILKRQAHVLDNSMYPENLTMRRAASEDSPHQPTNLSMKSGGAGGAGSSAHHPLSMGGTSIAPAPTTTSVGLIRKESPEAKKARAERLADSLRYHQEILSNSPLIKRPGERNFSGFRHCYANTVHNHSVKPEPPLDTGYS